MRQDAKIDCIGRMNRWHKDSQILKADPKSTGWACLEMGVASLVT